MNKLYIEWGYLYIQQQKMSDYPVVLYDGVRAFCCANVTILVTLDRRHTIRYASPQSTVAERLLARARLTQLRKEISSCALVMPDGSVYTKLEASLYAFGGIFVVVLWLGMMLPASWRDEWIAANRYRFMGKIDVYLTQVMFYLL